MEKTIYELDLHEMTTIKTHGKGHRQEWWVTRVNSGWIYECANPNIMTPICFFVPDQQIKQW